MPILTANSRKCHVEQCIFLCQLNSKMNLEEIVWLPCPDLAVIFQAQTNFFFYFLTNAIAELLFSVQN